MQNQLEFLSVSKHEHDFKWPAISYYNPSLFRRADLDIIDAIEDRKLWMMHLCVYPHVHDPAPIYGLILLLDLKRLLEPFMTLVQ